MTEDKEVGRRVHYADEDQAGSHHPRPSVKRAASTSSLSIRSVHSRVVAPETALPITYRTVFPPGELVARLATSLSQGVSDDQISRRAAEHGANKPTSPPNEWARKIMGYFFGGFGVLLFLGSLLVFVAWRPLGDPPAIANLALAIVLVAVFFIQAGFNAWQDWSSSKVMASITTMLPDECLVMRNGTLTTTSAEKLVPGDVMKIKQGNKLPADMRFVEASPDVKVDRSILTGESEAVPGNTESTDNNYLETQCIGLQGTSCVSGNVTGVCVATGDKTVFGRVATLTNKPRHELTPIQKEVRRFVLIIACFITAVVVLVVVLWATWLRKSHPDWIDVPLLIVDCVSVGIAFIPEGLPVAVAASLTIGAKIMKKDKILCKSLSTVETLGAVSVIRSDKTGTLTKNEMFVTNWFAGDQEYGDDDDAKAAGQNRDSPTNGAIDRIRIAGALCNSADFDYSTTKLPSHLLRMYGDPTDQAILRFSESVESVQNLRKQWKKEFEVAFNSRNKFMIRVMSPESTSQEFTSLWIKGAPDVLISRCTRRLQSDGILVPLFESDRSRIGTIRDKWSKQGKRVILIAQKILSSKMATAVKTARSEKAVMDLARDELTLVGLWALIDPLREDIPTVINTLRNASIRVMMVTGDFKLTAQAIAFDSGIITSAPALIHGIDHLGREFEKSDASADEDAQRSLVISGRELITLNDEQWDQLSKYKEIVFARTTPEQKLRIVKEFQSRDAIVAMTGDRVNDAPALKAADVGVALGSGSDIAIEAADMVLPDAFSAIVEAVKYGRLTFDNLKKTIIYLLSAGSFSELWPVMANVILGVPQVLSSFLMIIICLFTDAGGAIALAYEKPEMDVLSRPPRNPKKSRLINIRFILHAYGFIGIYECLLSFLMAFWYMSRRGIPFSAMVFKFGNMAAQYDEDYVTEVTNKASSIYFVNLVVMQFFNLLAVRMRRLRIFQQPPLFNRLTRNRLLFATMAWSLCIVFIFCYSSEIQQKLDTRAVPVEHFFLPVAFGIGLLTLDEARKFCVRRWPKGLLARLAW